MPIHDQSYRRYGGRREDVRRAWTVIASTGIMTFLKRRAFLGLLLVAWLPFIVRAVQIFIAANFPQASSILAMGAEQYRAFFDQQGIFVFFVTVYVGAGLIANDRRANALQIYLARPITRAEYVAGKMAVLVTFLLAVTLLPGLLLFLLQAAFAGSFAFAREHIYLVPAMTIFSLVQVLVASFTMLALSSLSNSNRFVGIMYTGIVLFTDAMYAALRGITGSTAVAWMSFPANLAQFGDLVFRQPLRYDVPIAVSLIVVSALIVVSLSVLERKVRGVEVVT
jgi:ABC-type transport system involved in multi-copper enzyme maturation permease subunit